MNGLQPETRFVCVDCPVDANYSGHEHWSTQLCLKCFGSPAMAPHFDQDEPDRLHSNWLKICTTGVHRAVQRDVGGLQVAQVSRADLTTFPVELEEPGDCAVCWTFELDEKNPRANFPRCTVEEHGCCVEGCLGQLRADKKLYYVVSEAGLPPATYFCKKCNNDERKAAEVAAVLRELEVLLAQCELEHAVEQLKAAHKVKKGSTVNVHLHEALDERLAAAK